MHAPNDHPAPKGLRGWWSSPPRSGMRLIIAPWEYRHLRAWARVHLAGGIVLAGLGVVTLSFGGDDWKTYGWTMAFLAAALGQRCVRLLGADHRSVPIGSQWLVSRTGQSVEARRGTPFRGMTAEVGPRQPRITPA